MLFSKKIAAVATCSLLLFGAANITAQEQQELDTVKVTAQQEFGKDDYYKNTVFKMETGSKSKKVFELTEEEKARIPKTPSAVIKTKLTDEKITQLKAKDPKKV